MRKSHFLAVKISFFLCSSFLLNGNAFTSELPNWNVRLGDSALHNLLLHPDIKSQDNIAIGRAALYKLQNGVGNLAIGSTSLRHLGTGSYNLALSSDALFSLVNGVGNVGIGYDSLHDLKVGTDNVAIGFLAGYLAPGSPLNFVEGNKLTLVGAKTGKSVYEEIENSTAIGFGSKVSQSNQVVIGNSDITSFLVANVDILSKIRWLERALLIFIFLNAILLMVLFKLIVLPRR
jgi:hypothetical protein